MDVIGLLGQKKAMTRLFTEDGRAVPVTFIQVGPCVVTQIRRPDGKDGYAAVQVGLVDNARKKQMTRALAGHLQAAGVEGVRVLREFRVETLAEELTVGQTLSADCFQEGDWVDVVGTSKGRGFQGVVKRHNFGGGRATHGSMFHRAPGSIGMAATPSRVLKGTRLPGRMGGKRVTVRKLEVVKVDAENGLLAVRGAVPGHHNAILAIRPHRKLGA